MKAVIPGINMQLVIIVAAAFLLIGGAKAQQQQAQDEDKRECISREEFESKFAAQQREIESLQKQLNYWQNTTINILMKYPVDGEGESSSCKVEVEDELSLKDLSQQMEEIFNQTQDKIESMRQELSQVSHPSLGSFLNPAPSCQLIPQGSPSGHYWIQNAGTGYANLEYCDMTRRCCNSTGGWMRVANLDMTDINQQCPSGFRLITSPKRTCGTPGSRCVSTTFPLNGVKYSRVCGKIIGYQYQNTNAFAAYGNDRSLTIDNNYVDGVSLTHGQTRRKHIWTFAAAYGDTRYSLSACPCTRVDTPYTGAVPPFIGQDYFCDTGNRYNPAQPQWYHADPLWDGSGCGPTSSCCGFNNPPWFCKQLPQPTTDDIEMRVCMNEPASSEDVGLETVEIYVQ